MRLLDSGSDGVAHSRDWARISPLLLILLILFFGLYLYDLGQAVETPHLVDNVFMQIHGAGHALFRVFGLTAAVAGGTFLQLFVPFALGYYFIWRRKPLGVALCMFFFFEQFLPVARYMADAQVQQLPWISIGRYESVIHDWNYLFTKLGILSYDVVIADVVRLIGYLGMIGVTFWFLWRGVNDIADDG